MEKWAKEIYVHIFFNVKAYFDYFTETLVVRRRLSATDAFLSHQYSFRNRKCNITFLVFIET
jgi:hypothetical protein